MNQETKTCQNCKQEFTIEQEDFNFYRKIDVPPPTFCSGCRLQRRLAWRNERAFYKRLCSLCKEEIISMYPGHTLFPVYCRRCWYSDQWEVLQYGREYDFSKPFFIQFKELLDVVPRIALQQDNCVNCDYANQIVNCKNCYLISSGSDNEDCYFSFRLLGCKNVLDSFALVKCEYLYETSMGRESSHVFFSQGVADSYNLLFCDEPRGSQNCFMSTNLRRKSYVFRNEQLSKKEYERRIENIDRGSYHTIEQLRQEFGEMLTRSIHPYGTFKNVVNTIGNALANAKNCYHCFHGSNLENCRYCLFVDDIKDSMDVNNGCCTMELYYEVCTAGVKSANVTFSVDAWPEVRNLSYCDSCRNGARDLFGCVSVRRKQYCILNKQYSKKEHEKLVSKIKNHMDEMPYTDKEGRVYKYGEFFPIELSPFPYSDTSAQEFFPLSQSEAEKHGYRWEPVEARDYAITLSASQLPDHIRDVPDEITKETIGCFHGGTCNERCTTAFRIIPDELQFYRHIRLPLPRLCPNCRHYQRMKERNPFRLWHRQCMCDYQSYKNTTSHEHHPEGRCSNKFETSYTTDRKEIVYCEQCYNNEIV